MTVDAKLMKNGLGARAVERFSLALAAAWPQFPAADFSTAMPLVLSAGLNFPPAKKDDIHPFFAPWPLIIAHQETTLATLQNWLTDSDEHVRKSVANNLNEICKDHPGLMLDVVERWWKDASENRQWIVRHACRTLIKKGDKRALELLGNTTNPKVDCALNLDSAAISMGGSLRTKVAIKSQARRTQNLMVDYVVHHMRSNGKTTPKVFKWKTVEILVGGKVLARKEFLLGS